MKIDYKSYLTLASTTALAQGFVFLISPVVTRLFTPADFGGFGLLLSVGAVLASVGTGRLEHAVPVAENLAQAIRVAILGTMMILAVSGASLLTILCLYYGGLIEHPAWHKLPLLTIPAIAFSLALYQLASALLLRQKSFRKVGLNKILQGVCTGLLQLSLGWLSLGALGLALAQALGYLAGSTAGVRQLLARSMIVARQRGFRLSATFQRYKRFPLILAPAALFNQATQQLPMLAIGYLFGLHEAGLYALVLRLCGAPLGLIGQSVAQVHAAEFRALLGSRSGVLALRYKGLLLRLFAIGLVVVAMIVSALEVGGAMFFGENWAGLGNVALFLAVKLVFDFATTPISMTLGYLEKQGMQLAWDIGRLCAVILVFCGAWYFSLQFEYALLMLSFVWALSDLIHVWITYRACLVASIGES